MQLFDQAAQAYQEMISSVNISKIEATIQEGRLTWLVYIIGAAVGGRVSFNRYYFEKIIVCVHNLYRSGPALTHATLSLLQCKE